MTKFLLFKPSCPNWQYCKLGTEKFFPFLLIFFHQVKAYYYSKAYRNDCFFDSPFFYIWIIIKYLSAATTISTNLSLALGMTRNCANQRHYISLDISRFYWLLIFILFFFVMALLSKSSLVVDFPRNLRCIQWTIHSTLMPREQAC